MAFLDQNYLLANPVAPELFAEIADLPIIDPHNHANVKEIYENENYSDIWQIEAATDHYVWEVLRKRGIPEEKITGNASNREKWLALAEICEDLAGNPTFEWIHLDLKRRFGISDIVTSATGEDIWQRTKDQLQTEAMKPRAMLGTMRVEAMCSTDDPIDSLQWHRKLADENFGTRVLPTFRPDKAMNIHKPDWRVYIAQLGERVGERMTGIQDVIAALKTCHDFFAENGCVASDHGVEVPHGYVIEREDADRVFRKAMNGDALSRNEEIAYMSHVLHAVAEMDAEKGWVFQLHMGAVRDVRDCLARDIGPDSGGDVSCHSTPVLDPLVPFLNRFDGQLKIVMYTLDPTPQSTLATLARAFGETVSLGSAWWLLDSPIGMRRQLEYVGTVDLLRNFSGMVSDSRKLLSYGSRHEMFRRVLCEVLGNLVTNGQIPSHLAERLARTMAYDRPKELFGL